MLQQLMVALENVSKDVYEREYGVRINVPAIVYYACWVRGILCNRRPLDGFYSLEYIHSRSGHLRLLGPRGERKLINKHEHSSMLQCQVKDHERVIGKTK